RSGRLTPLPAARLGLLRKILMRSAEPPGCRHLDSRDNSIAENPKRSSEALQVSGLPPEKPTCSTAVDSSLTCHAPFSHPHERCASVYRGRGRWSEKNPRGRSPWGRLPPG